MYAVYVHFFAVFYYFHISLFYIARENVFVADKNYYLLYMYKESFMLVDSMEEDTRVYM